MQTFKVGVVGAGHIVTHKHIPVFKKLKGVEVAAVCDKNYSVARAVAERFGIRSVHGILREMLKEKLDIVDICTPPQTHSSLATEAMEAGCHILAEKPLAMSVGEVDDLIRVANREHVRLCAVHQNLFNPAVQKARHLVESGVIGDLIGVDVGTFNTRNDYMLKNSNHWCHTLPGGAFFELLPHPIYLLQIFLRGIGQICILTSKLGDFQWMAADEIRVLVKAGNGVGTITGSCNSPFQGDSLDILGTKLGLQVDLWGRSIVTKKPRTEQPLSVGRTNLDLAYQSLALLRTTFESSLKAVLHGIEVSAHYAFMKEFVTCLRTGGKLPVEPHEARENVRILEAICNR